MTDQFLLPTVGAASTGTADARNEAGHSPAANARASLKRDVDAAQLDALGGDERRARRDAAGGSAPGSRDSETGYWGGVSDDDILAFLKENPLLARLMDRLGAATGRDTAPDGAGVASDDEYGSLPDLSSYQFTALEKGLSIEVDGNPVTDARSLEEAALRSLRDAFRDEVESRTAEASLAALFERQAEELRLKVDWNDSRIEELKEKLTKADADSYDGAAYSRAGVEYRRKDGVTPVEDRQLIGRLRAHKLSSEYQDGLQKLFSAAGNAGGLHRPPKSMQRGIFDDSVDDEVLIAGKPDLETGRCPFHTQKQHTKAFGRNIVSRGGERLNETLDGKMLFFKSLDGDGSLQPKHEFCSANGRAQFDKRMKRHNVSVKDAVPGNSMQTGAHHPPLLIRIYGDNGEPEFTGMWPHREKMGSLTDLISAHGEQNIWLKTEDNIYKNPTVYGRTEPDSAFRTFAQMTGWPVAWVRIADDRYVDVKTYQKMRGEAGGDSRFAADPGQLDTLILTRDGDAYVTPRRLREMEPDAYEETMHMVGLSPGLATVSSKPAPEFLAIEAGELVGRDRLTTDPALIPADHQFVQTRQPDGQLSGDFTRLPVFTTNEAQLALIGTDSVGSSACSEASFQAMTTGSPATSPLSESFDPRRGERDTPHGM